MPKSADTTPLPESLHVEESDVVDLTEEVTRKVSSVAEKEDVAELDELVALGLKMPEFRVPEDDKDEPDEEELTSPSTARISANELLRHHLEDVKKLGGGSSEVPVDFESKENSSMDRQAMVKTIQLDAIDRATFERMTRSQQDEINAFLEDPCFSPEIIANPPRVLVRKWQEGLPVRVTSVIGEERRVPEIPETLSPSEDARDTDIVPPENLPAGLSLDEESELIELDDESLEFDDDISSRAAAVPPLELPPEVAEAMAAGEVNRPVAEVPLPPAEAPGPSDAAGDAEVKEVVRELLEEQKEEKESQTKRLRPRDVWFREVFTEEYLRTMPDNLDEITASEAEFIRKSLKLKKGSRILDLACGFGRHSLRLAQDGYELVGLDLSMPLLQKALAEAQRRSLNVKFIHGDMRELSFSTIFDGVFIWDTSLGYFDDRTNLRVLQGIHRSLKNGGRLLIDVINRDYVVQQTPTRLWWEGKGCIFLEESEFDYQTSTLHAKRSFIYEDGTRPLEQNSFIRLYNAHELRQMLHVAGFKVLEISGERHHKGYFLGASSHRIIILAEKRLKKKG